jgi:hypothetical protein
VESLTKLRERCDEGPYKIGGPGFAAGPATKWPWFGELGGRGYLVAAVHRGKNLLVTGEVARLLDPICRAEIERMRAADRGWAGCWIILPPRDHPASAPAYRAPGRPILDNRSPPKLGCRGESPAVGVGWCLTSRGAGSGLRVGVRAVRPPPPTRRAPCSGAARRQPAGTPAVAGRRDTVPARGNAWSSRSGPDLRAGAG